nr:hypothetical protein [Tanacetum cinerariifolium]GFA01683.1 hypothetical protein [Tanacetum cinerariifolium]
THPALPVSSDTPSFRSATNEHVTSGSSLNGDSIHVVTSVSRHRKRTREDVRPIETLNAWHSLVYDDLGDCDQRCQYYGAAFWYGEPLSRSAVLETINEENKHESQANDSVCLPPQIGWLSYACHVNIHTMAGITCFETCTLCGCYMTYQLKSEKVLEVLNGSREALITKHGFWCSGTHDVPIKDTLYPTVGYFRL